MAALMLVVVGAVLLTVNAILEHSEREANASLESR